MTTVLAAEELNPLVPHTVEIIVGTIAFLLLLFVLWKTVFPQFEKIYAERTDKIEGGLKRADEAQQEANDLKRQYEEQLAGLRAEAARIRDDARAEGQQIKSELRAQAEEEAARIRQRGEEQIAAAREQAVRQLRGEIGGLSVQLAERIIGDSLADDTRRSATVDSFLAELDGMTDRGTPAPAGGAS
ncbi:F0F1 ATP synthase subunit B [Pseudonocardia kunmingensis]|uniref:ATP synthase subunit b n=1 Tax=Pseudonocardia kunmingensis TaxID=630975 RepID=A0A543E083_9PSEU|nr:F0F1 ATP synthase subunit B [Pseudonocardia kunmingensis]TQM14995.1 ATP synthase F0 subcomplex B subunit [Pseudonocardia kunmingensis]